MACDMLAQFIDMGDFDVPGEHGQPHPTELAEEAKRGSPDASRLDTRLLVVEVFAVAGPLCTALLGDTPSGQGPSLLAPIPDSFAIARTPASIAIGSVKSSAKVVSEPEDLRRGSD